MSLDNQGIVVSDGKVGKERVGGLHPVGPSALEPVPPRDGDSEWKSSTTDFRVCQCKGDQPVVSEGTYSQERCRGTGGVDTRGKVLMRLFQEVLVDKGKVPNKRNGFLSPPVQIESKFPGKREGDLQALGLRSGSVTSSQNSNYFSPPKS